MYKRLLLGVLITAATTCGILFLVNENQKPAFQIKHTHIKLWSKSINDSFDVIVTTFPKNGHQPRIKKAMYYLDAGIDFGCILREELASGKRLYDSNTAYIGLAHIGGRDLRLRDYKPATSNLEENALPNNNKGARFYQFLTKWVMPMVNRRFNSQPVNTIIGHSLGGLFTVYAYAQDDSLFKYYYAFSPPLWFDYFDIVKNIEKTPFTRDKGKYLCLMNGGFELNAIKCGNDLMPKVLRKYHPQLAFDVWAYPSDSHESYVRKAIDRMLKQQKKAAKY